MKRRFVLCLLAVTLVGGNALIALSSAEDVLRPKRLVEQITFPGIQFPEVPDPAMLMDGLVEPIWISLGPHVGADSGALLIEHLAALLDALPDDVTVAFVEEDAKLSPSEDPRLWKRLVEKFGGEVALIPLVLHDDPRIQEEVKKYLEEYEMSSSVFRQMYDDPLTFIAVTGIRWEELQQQLAELELAAGQDVDQTITAWKERLMRLREISRDAIQLTPYNQARILKFHLLGERRKRVELVSEKPPLEAHMATLKSYAYLRLVKTHRDSAQSYVWLLHHIYWESQGVEIRNQALMELGRVLANVPDRRRAVFVEVGSGHVGLVRQFVQQGYAVRVLDRSPAQVLSQRLRQRHLGIDHFHVFVDYFNLESLLDHSFVTMLLRSEQFSRGLFHIGDIGDLEALVKRIVQRMDLQDRRDLLEFAVMHARLLESDETEFAICRWLFQQQQERKTTWITGEEMEFLIAQGFLPRIEPLPPFDTTPSLTAAL